MREGASYPQSGQSYHRLDIRPVCRFLADTNVSRSTLRQLRSGRDAPGARHGTPSRLSSRTPRPHRVAVDEDCSTPFVPMIRIWRSMQDGLHTSLGVPIRERRRAALASPVGDTGILRSGRQRARSRSSLPRGVGPAVHGGECRFRVRCTGRSSGRRTHRPGGGVPREVLVAHDLPSESSPMAFTRSSRLRSNSSRRLHPRSRSS